MSTFQTCQSASMLSMLPSELCSKVMCKRKHVMRLAVLSGWHRMLWIAHASLASHSFLPHHTAQLAHAVFPAWAAHTVVEWQFRLEMTWQTPAQPPTFFLLYLIHIFSCLSFLQTKHRASFQTTMLPCMTHVGRDTVVVSENVWTHTRKSQKTFTINQFADLVPQGNDDIIRMASQANVHFSLRRDEGWHFELCR